MADGATGSKKNEQLARDNWARYEYGKRRGHAKYCEAAVRLNRFYVGRGTYDTGGQWDDEDAAYLEGEGRKPIEFNELFDAVNTALGNHIQNRVDFSYRARGQGADDDTATTLSRVAMQVADNNDYRYCETEVATDGYIQQRGYFDIRVDYNENLTGEIRIETLDPMDVIPDPDAKHYDPDKWQDVITTRWMTLDQIELHYGAAPRRRIEARIGNNANGVEGETDYGTDELDGVRRSRFGDDDDYPDAGDLVSEINGTGHVRVRIIDRQHWRMVKAEVALFPTGDIRLMEDEPEQNIQAALAAGAMLYKRPMRRVRWTVSSYGDVLLFDKWSPYKNFTVVPFFPFFRRGITRGLIDNAIGPQEMTNKAISQYLHIINSMANSGWLVQQNSLTNMSTDDLTQQGAETGLVIEFKEGTTKPEKIQPNQVPTGIDRLVALGSQKIRTITGISDAIRGQAGPNQSGKAIQSLQFGSQLSLAVPLDNLARTRAMLAKRVLALIQGFMDTPQLLRIVDRAFDGTESTEDLQLNWQREDGTVLNDVTIGEYDVVVTEQPSQVTFENSQHEQGMAMKEKGAPIPWSYLIRTSNLAEKHELAKYAEQMEGQQSNPAEEAKAALAIAQATAKNVEALFSAMRAAQLLRSDPALAGIADTIAKSGGFRDADGGESIPGNVEQNVAAAPPTSTNPTTPDNPGVGLTTGIEAGNIPA